MKNFLRDDSNIENHSDFTILPLGINYPFKYGHATVNSVSNLLRINQLRIRMCAVRFRQKSLGHIVHDNSMVGQELEICGCNRTSVRSGYILPWGVMRMGNIKYIGSWQQFPKRTSTSSYLFAPEIIPGLEDIVSDLSLAVLGSSLAALISFQYFSQSDKNDLRNMRVRKDKLK